MTAELSAVRGIDGEEQVVTLSVGDGAVRSENYQNDEY